MDILLNTLYTSGYVGSLFVLPSARTGGGRREPTTGRLLDRNSPKVMKTRIASVTIASVVSLAAAGALAKQQNPALSTKDVASLLGLWKSDLSPKQLANLVVLPLTCTASLFLGPLYALFLESSLPGMRNFNLKRDIVSTLKSLPGIRNYLAVMTFL